MLVIGLLFPAAVSAQDDAESIQKFVGRKDQWSALLGARFVLEGRVGVVSAQTLQFDGCDLTFRLKPGLPVLTRDTRVAEVSGVIVREGQKLYFDVDGLRRRDTDLETLRARRARIDSTRADAWYGLADWAASRGEFYGDNELRAKAEELREIGLTTESRRLKPGDIEGLLALAKKANDWKLDQGIAWRFIHDACRIELTQARRDPRNHADAVLARVIKGLPGSQTPLKPEEQPLRASYERNPSEVYAKADNDTRFKLHRALYTEVLLSRIEGDARPDGSNGYDIAARIAQQIPELESLVEQYRLKELAHLGSRVEMLSRNEIVDYSRKLAERKQDREARDVKLKWLRAREPAARVEGPRGLMRLADDYQDLLADQETATALYESAWILNPQSPEAAAWLTARGLVQDGTRWVPKSAASAPMTDRFAQAIQEGQVLAGMTAQQARAAMGARPAAIVRQASRGKTTELWIYRAEGLVISLSKATGAAQAQVDSVASLGDEAP